MSRDVRRRFVGVLLSMGALPATALITGPLIARALGPDDRGIAAGVLTPLLLATWICPVGLNEAMTVAIAKMRTSPGRALRMVAPTAVVSGVVAALVMIVAAPDLFPGDDDAQALLCAAAFLVPVSVVIGLVRAALQGEQAFGWINAERWASALLRLVLVSALFLAGALTVSSVVWITWGGSVLSGLILVYALVRRRRQSDLAPGAVEWSRREYLTYGLRGAGVHLAVAGNARLDQLLMVPLTSADQLGYYAVAVSLAEIPQLISGAIGSLLLPAASGGAVAQLTGRAVRMVVLLTVLVAAMGGALAAVLIPVLFGDVFQPAVLPCVLLFLAAVPFSASAVLTAGLQAMGRPGVASWAELLGLTLTVGGLLVFLPEFGAVGAATVSCGVYTVIVIVKAIAFCQLSGARLRELLPNVREVSTIVKEAGTRVGAR